MTPRESVFMLWPTRLSIFEWHDPEYDAALVRLILREHERRAPAAKAAGSDAESHVYRLFEIDDPLIDTLRQRVLTAIRTYLGPQAEGTHDGISLGGRAVLIGDGGHIASHAERREADLTIAYWPLGSGSGPAIGVNANPVFVVEDPSRHLTDLRLPAETRHSIPLALRPGLMAVFPAHVPHHQRPYRGEHPHIQIVCLARIAFTDSYYLNRW